MKPELSKNRRKNRFSWISRAVLYIFSWNFGHWCKMAIPKMWQSPIYNKHTFPAENAGNMPENRFLAFSQDFIISFFCFFAQRCVLAMPKIWRRKWWKYAIYFCTVNLIVFPLFLFYSSIFDCLHQVGPISIWLG